MGAACACGTEAVVEQITAQNAPNQVDLLLMVDNGASAGEKEALLALAVPELIEGLVNPRCLDDTTNLPVAVQPSSPVDPCPTGSQREFAPILDMHIGVLSSSLGTFGAHGCLDPTPATPCSIGSTNNDHGHLVTRSDPCGTAAPVATYQNTSFLAWDPTQKLSPPGQSSVGDPTAVPAVPGLTTSLYDLVLGDGSLGCGFRSQNESWYRFLVDPTPYQSIALVNDTVQTSGIDQTLLQQRSDFLRPGSLLAIVTVTDHTDASIKEESQFPLFAEDSLHLPLARTECTTKGPTDPCCASCGQSTPPGCAPQPSCTVNGQTASYTAATENTALRAFGLVSHKQRYGIEFFYPPSRYVQALTSATVLDENQKVVPNPIYSVLGGQSGAVRDPSLVLYATITGVPWQLVARQKNGVPDLINGVDALDPTQVGGFKTAAELSNLDPHGHAIWDDIAGDPENYVAPLSPFMVESTTPRSGVDPITGIVISPTTTPNTDGNAINGHERTIALPAGDIEYACTFPLLAPVDCSNPSVGYCECTSPSNDNPLCAPNPVDSGKPTLQVGSKAYPGLRNLAIARGMGDQGVVASICAKQIVDDTAADYGYRPAVEAILDSFRRTLKAPVIGGKCLPQSLPVNGQGVSGCSLLEATKLPAGETCDCGGAARIPVPAADACFQQAAEKDPLQATAQWNCFCEIAQTSGADLTACQIDAGAGEANGWCYIDATVTPPVGNPALVASCPAGDDRVLRFVGAGAPSPGATVFLACH